MSILNRSSSNLLKFLVVINFGEGFFVLYA